VPIPLRTSSAVAATAMSAEIRVESSTDITSRRYSGAGVSARRMPAWAA
jgi:hypothetical protein